MFFVSSVLAQPHHDLSELPRYDVHVQHLHSLLHDRNNARPLSHCHAKRYATPVHAARLGKGGGRGVPIRHERLREITVGRGLPAPPAPFPLALDTMGGSPGGGTIRCVLCPSSISVNLGGKHCGRSLRIRPRDGQPYEA